MRTKTLTSAQVEQAAWLIRQGQLVAFPTETVYGLGANALSAEAAGKIYKAKERPLSNPLIVHCGSVEEVRCVAELTPQAEKLATAFWPGPLTMVLQKKDVIPDIVTSGRDTVGVRIPAHSVALELIRRAGVPIAAPSANTFMRTSPTEAGHVMQDLDGKIAAVISAGQSTIGVESTVIDMTSRYPRILRPGAVSFRQLKKVLPTVKDHTGLASKKSPGQYKYHYCPKTPLVLVRSFADVARLVRQNPHQKAALLSYSEWLPQCSGLPIAMYDWGSRTNMEQLARRLYAGLRELDATGADILYCPLPKEAGLGQAVVNRLKKAGVLYKRTSG